MTDRICNLKKYIISNKHHKYRKTLECNILLNDFKQGNLSEIQRITKRFEYILKNQQPIVLKDEYISLFRTITNIPDSLW